MGWTTTRRVCAAGTLVICIWPGPSSAAPGAPDAAGACPANLTKRIPTRQSSAHDGTGFTAGIASDQSQTRESAIQDELLQGNLPDFLRRLKPVKLSAALPDGRTVDATICVMPDYLSVGTDRDFLRVPMNLHSAADVARRFGFVLPTRKMVDAIHSQSAAQLTPRPMQAGPQMRSTAYYAEHNRDIRAQRLALGIPLGALISGHKKDVVISNRLAGNPGRIAIYGWHKPDGRPIQPLSTVHGAGYADYSHGIRLVSETMFLDGKPVALREVLGDPAIARLLSDEGPVRISLARLARPATELAQARRTD